METSFGGKAANTTHIYNKWVAWKVQSAFNPITPYSLIKLIANTVIHRLRNGKEVLLTKVIVNIRLKNHCIIGMVGVGNLQEIYSWI